MDIKMTNIEVVNFLQDYNNNSETIVLQEGKEKSELEKIAEARGMKIKGSRDLAIFKTIYAFTDKPNSNGAILPKKELLRILPQIIGKPININHNRRFVVGHYIDYKFIQKEDKAIAYGVFYKNHFADEWTRAQDLFKKKKLSSSFEIWSPDETREDMGGGKFRMHDMEISGGALVYEDKNNVPAFKGAKVLEMAQKRVPELVYATKYKEDEIITSGDYFKDSVKENVERMKKEKEIKDIDLVKEKETPKPEEKKVEEKKEVKVEEKKVEPKVEVKKEEKPKEEVKVEKKIEEKKEEPKVENSKIKCSNCGHEWEISSQPEYKMGSEKCSKCFAIIDQTGKMIYPPQIIDFKMLCPACKVKNWLIMAKEEVGLKLKCLSCAKEYNVSFKTNKPNETLEKIGFMYSGDVSCYQCRNRIHFTNVSTVKTKELTCKKCGLTFAFDIEEYKKYKNISKIEEIIEKKIEKSSEQGGNKAMELKLGVKKDDATMPKDLGESKEVAKEEKVVVNATVEEQPEVKENPEAKVEEPKAEETPKAVEAPKTEELKGNELVESMRDKSEIKKSRFEYILEEIEDEIKVGAKEIKKTAQLTTKQRNALPDNLFAVVVNVKNKRTGKMRKIRMFPINDKAHVRNALARLGQPAPQATLKRLGVSIEAVRAKILKRARQLKMTQLLERYKSAIKKLGEKYLELKKSSIEKVEFYKENAKKILERREELGEEYAKDLSDIDIVNDDKFNLVKIEKENLLLKAQLETSSEEDIVVGIKPQDNDDDYYSKHRKEITKKAFKKSPKK